MPGWVVTLRLTYETTETFKYIRRRVRPTARTLSRSTRPQLAEERSLCPSIALRKWNIAERDTTWYLSVIIRVSMLMAISRKKKQLWMESKFIRITKTFLVTAKLNRTLSSNITWFLETRYPRIQYHGIAKLVNARSVASLWALSSVS